MSVYFFSRFWVKIIKTNTFFFMILIYENLGKILITDISDTMKNYASHLSFRDLDKILLIRCSPMVAPLVYIIVPMSILIVHTMI